MFGKGTFKSSGKTHTNVSVSTSGSHSFPNSKISVFNEAENAAGNANEVIKAVQLYNQFLNEADNSDEGIRVV